MVGYSDGNVSIKISYTTDGGACIDYGTSTAMKYAKWSCDNATSTAWPSQTCTTTISGNIKTKRLKNISWATTDTKYGRTLEWTDCDWANSTSTSYATSCYDDEWQMYSWADRKPTPPPDPGQRLREIMAERAAPRIIIPGHRKALDVSKDVRELRARDTLRRVIGDEKFRAFLSRGFVSVKGKDGHMYQLFPGHGITHVFEQGKLIEKLCVVFPGNFTPTDSLIMRYLMLLNNPRQFWDTAIKHGQHNGRQPFEIKPADDRSLNDIYRELKTAAA